jgi:hypothetical protein
VVVLSNLLFHRVTSPQTPAPGNICRYDAVLQPRLVEITWLISFVLSWVNNLTTIAQPHSRPFPSSISSPLNLRHHDSFLYIYIYFFHFYILFSRHKVSTPFPISYSHDIQCVAIVFFPCVIKIDQIGDPSRACDIRARQTRCSGKNMSHLFSFILFSLCCESNNNYACIKSSIFRDITARSPLKVNERFGGTCRLHNQGRRISQTRNQYEAGINQKFAVLATCFMLVSSPMKVEARCSSEASVYFQRTICRYIPEDRTLHNHRCENLKSYVNI